MISRAEINHERSLQLHGWQGLLAFALTFAGAALVTHSTVFAQYAVPAHVGGGVQPENPPVALPAKVARHIDAFTGRRWVIDELREHSDGADLASGLARIGCTDLAFEVRERCRSTDAQEWMVLRGQLAAHGDELRAGRAFDRALALIVSESENGCAPGAYLEALIERLVDANLFKRLPAAVAPVEIRWHHIQPLMAAAARAAASDPGAARELYSHAWSDTRTWS